MLQEGWGITAYREKQTPKQHSQTASKDIMRYKIWGAQNYLPMTILSDKQQLLILKNTILETIQLFTHNKEGNSQHERNTTRLEGGRKLNEFSPREKRWAIFFKLNMSPRFATRAQADESQSVECDTTWSSAPPPRQHKQVPVHKAVCYGITRNSF